MLLIVTLLRLFAWVHADYDGSESNTPYERAVRQTKLFQEKMVEFAKYQAEHPYNLFVRGAAFTTNVALYPKMKLFLLTVNVAIPTKCLFFFNFIRTIKLLTSCR